MISVLDVQNVARTAIPHDAGNGHVLTIDYVVQNTRSHEWDGCLYELGASAAADLAIQFNQECGLNVKANGRKPAINGRTRK